MLRLATIIVVLAAVIVALVHVRRQQTQVRYEIQRGLDEQIALRRTLWDQRVRIGELETPAEVRKRAREMALKLTDDEGAKPDLATAGGPKATIP